jgi:hypothetical protein
MEPSPQPVDPDALRRSLVIFEVQHSIIGEEGDLPWSLDPDFLAYEALSDVTKDEDERSALMARTIALRNLFADTRMQPFIRGIPGEGKMVHRDALVLAAVTELDQGGSFNPDTFFERLQSGG